MNAVVQQQTFEERLMGRIKDSIGELMTEEDLKKIVERGIEEALFKPRVSRSDGYGRVETKPSMVQEIVERFLTAHVRDAVDKWLADNQDKVLPMIEKVLQAGIGSALIAALNSKFDWQLQQFSDGLRDSLGQR